jgi:hypothetical protein
LREARPPVEGARAEGDAGIGVFVSESRHGLAAAPPASSGQPNHDTIAHGNG